MTYFPALRKKQRYVFIQKLLLQASKADLYSHGKGNVSFQITHADHQVTWTVAFPAQMSVGALFVDAEDDAVARRQVGEVFDDVPGGGELGQAAAQIHAVSGSLEFGDGEFRINALRHGRTVVQQARTGGVVVRVTVDTGAKVAAALETRLLAGNVAVGIVDPVAVQVVVVDAHALAAAHKHELRRRAAVFQQVGFVVRAARTARLAERFVAAETQQLAGDARRRCQTRQQHGEFYQTIHYRHWRGRALGWLLRTLASTLQLFTTTTISWQSVNQLYLDVGRSIKRIIMVQETDERALSSSSWQLINSLNCLHQACAPAVAAAVADNPNNYLPI